MKTNSTLKSLVLCFLFLSGLLASSQVFAQVIDTVSYVPVKQGYYDKISTKTKAQFSTDTSSTVITNLTANSSDLNLITSKVSFGKPVYVKDSVFVRDSGPSASLKISGALKVQGEAYANGMVIATKTPNVTKVVARDLYLKHRNVRLASSSSIVVNGVSLPAPSGCSEGTEWRSVQGYDTDDKLNTYSILACKGTGSAPTCSAIQADISACNNSCANHNLCYWDATNCCCVSSKPPLMIDASMCSGTGSICNGNEITSATDVCNQYSSDSAECVCALGNLKQCVGKVYGGASDEAGCVQSGEYHEACNCEYFIEFQSNYRNLACTGLPALCEDSTYQPCSVTARPISSQTCKTCGVQTRTVTCDMSTGTWNTGSWSVCDTSDCPTSSDACCCNGSVEIHNTAGYDCSVYDYTPKLQGCVCAQDSCNSATASLCSDCGGTWNSNTCTCDCGTYSGGYCTFDSRGCKCGDAYRSCR